MIVAMKAIKWNLLCFIIIHFSHAQAGPEKAITFIPSKCDIHDELPVKYKVLPPQHADTKETPIQILVSDEFIHQTESRILQLVLEEVLQFQNVHIEYYENLGLQENANDVLYFMDHSSTHENPSFMVNLETHLPIFYTIQYDHVKERGLTNDILPRYGLFIDQHHSNFEENIQLDWRVLQQTSSSFINWSLPLTTLTTELKRVFVSDNCDASCPIIMTHRRYKYYNQELIRLAGEYNLSIQLVEPIVENSLDIIRNNSALPLFVFSWSLSDILNGDIKFNYVEMPPCSSVQVTKGCLFHQVSRVKMVSDSMEMLDEGRLGRLLNTISFTEEDQQQWLNEYFENRHDSNEQHEQIACQWLKQNLPRALSWIHDSATMKIPVNVAVYIVQNDPVLQATIDLTLDGIERSNVLKYTTLTKYVNTDGCRRSKRIIGNALTLSEQFRLSKADIIVGPWCSESLQAIEETATIQQVPVLNYAASGLDVSHRYNDTTLFSVFGDMGDLIVVISLMMKQFAWQKLAAITVKGESHTNYINKIQTRDPNLIVYNREIADDNAIVDQALEDISEGYRIIWVDVNPSVLSTILCKAYAKQMTSKHGYVWIFPEELATLKRKLQKSDCFDLNCDCSDLQTMLEGTFIIQRGSLFNDNQMIQEGITAKQWKTELSARIAEIGLIKKHVINASMSNLVTAKFLHDSLWTVARVVAILEETRPSVFGYLDSQNQRSRAIIQELRSFVMKDGLTGAIDFHARNGSRANKFTLFQETVSSNNEPNLVEIAIFPSENQPPQFNEMSVVWSQGRIPFDRPMCSILSIDMECDTKKTTIIILVSSLILIVSIIVLGYINLKSYLRFRNALNKISPSILQMFKEAQIPYRNLNLAEQKLLGQGEFGQVMQGTLKEKDSKGHEVVIPVAVKFLKNNSDFLELRDFLLEAESLITLNHPNIIKLIGICLGERQICIILEYMEQGDLRTYLIKRTNLALQPENRGWLSRQLTNYAGDIARALVYLESQTRLHRDIACRNVLIHADGTAKLADFGFSRDVCDNGYYRFERKGKLPLRWMSPEAISEGRYSTASDMWSFGVLMYEIITFGANPYFQYYDEALRDEILSGKTIDLPLDTPLGLKKVMLQCWDYDPEKRPKPHDLLNFFAAYPSIVVPCIVIDKKFMPPSIQRQLSADSGYVPPRSEMGGGSTACMQYAALQFLTHPSRQTTYSQSSFGSFEQLSPLPSEIQTSEPISYSNTDANETRYIPMKIVGRTISENGEYFYPPSSTFETPLLPPTNNFESRCNEGYQALNFKFAD